MKRVLLWFALVMSLSAMAASPTAEERLAENNFQIVSDLYQERPIWIKSYHCDSTTAVRMLMNNPQVVIEREFEGRLICHMNDVQLLRSSDRLNNLPSFMRWAATLYFTVEIAADSYEVILHEAVWNGVIEHLDDPRAVTYTLYDLFFTARGNIDNKFVRSRAGALNERLTMIFAPRLQ